MKINDQDLTKLYYSIGEVAKMFGVSKSLIRFWEAEFDSLRPHKNSKGDRRFTKQNIQQFKVIHELVKERGFTIKGAKQELTENKEKYENRENAIQTLTKLRGFLVDLKEKL
jgi:DNA-binding transcriptional MerR regulator